MSDPLPDDIVFNLSAFRRRARSELKRRGFTSAVTLSKRLFNGHAWALGKILNEKVREADKTYPRLDTLLKAERQLSDLESEAIRKAS